jgi:hypothetical protein
MRKREGAAGESAQEDSGLASFILIARFFDVAADPAQLCHEFCAHGERRFRSRATARYRAPGMVVSAEVKTGTRRLMEYFLSPIIQSTSESVRER